MREKHLAVCVRLALAEMAVDAAEARAARRPDWRSGRVQSWGVYLRRELQDLTRWRLIRFVAEFFKQLRKGTS